jgi:hypothetical protein
MGIGDHGVLVFGVALRDDRADVAYGLYERWISHRVLLPGDEPDLPALGQLRRREAVEKPQNDLDGRHWIGVWLADLPALPPALEHKVWPADAPELAGLVRLPAVDERVMARAVGAFTYFGAWCLRRGVDLGPPSLLVSADYD